MIYILTHPMQAKAVKEAIIETFGLRHYAGIQPMGHNYVNDRRGRVAIGIVGLNRNGWNEEAFQHIEAIASKVSW